MRYNLAEDIIKYSEMGNVWEEDREKYSEAMNIESLKSYFRQGNTSFSLFYRRKLDDEFKTVKLEMVLADDYANDNQSLFLYIRYVE